LPIWLFKAPKAPSAGSPAVSGREARRALPDEGGGTPPRIDAQYLAATCEYVTGL